MTWVSDTPLPLILDAICTKWRRHGQGATSSEITAFEEKYGIRLPADVRAYFETVNGTLLGAYNMEDRDLLSFWHLDQVRTFAEEGIKGDPDAAHSFVFADYSMWGYAFAVRLSKDPTAPAPVVVDIGSPHQIVAGSLAEFLERYLKRDKDIIYPSRPKTSGPA